MISAVLFDLDGTLLDTLPDIHYYLNKSLAQFGYPSVEMRQTQSYVGDGAEMLIERAMPVGATNCNEVYAYFRKEFAKSKNERTKLYEGEMECLFALKQSGKKLAVITNKPQEAAFGCVKTFFPDDLFDYVGGDSGAFPRKPDPALAFDCAKRLGVPAEECAFVGDGEPDALTALNAGMFGVSALWGYRSKEQLLLVGATNFASNYSELTKILQKS